MNLLECFKSPKKVENDFDLLPDGLFVLENDSRIININKKLLEIYNMTRFDFIGRYFSDFVENGTSLLNKAIANNSVVTARAIVDEGQPSMTLEISAVRNLEDERVFVSVRDITNKQKEQNSINEQYAIAKKIIDEKNDFLIGSSGGILSTLVSTAGFSRALLDGIGGALSEKQQKYLNIINTNSKDLSYDLEKLFMLFKVESKKVEYNFKKFDLISLIKSINRVFEKDIKDKRILFFLDYSKLTKRDCNLDSEVVEYILRCIMEIFVRFSNYGKCSLNIGHPPIEFLKEREFRAKTVEESDKYVLFEAKITDMVFTEEELENIFDAYDKSNKRPIGLKASLNLMKMYITDFGGDIKVYSRQNFGTIISFVLPLN